MKSLPRKLRSPLAAALCGACVALAPPPTSARQERPARGSPQRAPTKEARQAAPRKGDAKAKERRERQQAVAALNEVAEGARALEDLEARADILSLAADALWPADEPAARAVFRRAWEAATAADLADTKRREEELRAKRTDGPSPSVNETTRARYGALQIVARRDPRAAETLLAELKPVPADEDEEESGAAAAHENIRRRNVEGERGLSPRGRQRLMVAWDLLLDQNEPVRAAQFAAPLVGEGPVQEFVRFVLQLRTKAPREADALYLRLLSQAASDPSADANDVLVLSCYVVSPQLFVTVSGEASVRLYAMGRENGEDSQGLGVPPAVRGAFYTVAAALLLRPFPPRSSEPEVLAESAALYFAAGRLLPFFERDAPQHAPHLRERMEALAGGIEGARRERLSAHMPTESMRPKNPSDPLEKFVEEMSDPVSRAERYGMRLRAVVEAARRKLWDRARKLAAVIADADARREASLVIASYQVKYLTETYADDEDEDDFEQAAAFAREADVPPAVRARGLAQAAEMAARKGRRERALELLEEGVGFALRADKGTGQRLDALAVLASLAARLDGARAWELLAEVVRAANAFDAAAKETPPPPAAPDAASLIQVDDREPLEKIFEPFRTGELFATMARTDVARTLTEARALEDFETRSGALVAAARAILERAAKSPGVASR